MNRQETLKSLASLLESFIERVVHLKEERLSVSEGIRRLDDIADKASQGLDMTDQAGDWFAEHNRWLTDSSLSPPDVSRINRILQQFKTNLRLAGEASLSEDKIHREIDRWSKTGEKLDRKLILRRGPEARAVAGEEQEDTIARFEHCLERLTAIFKDTCGGKKHILSVADDLLKAARLQSNKDALILSAFVIYYLKQNGYKVEPYVKKLREAEAVIGEGISGGQ
ncbi:MAG: hypothetical protein JSW34_02340 [Candidatus Zixiibacteriota bacterium]|nr:MAG: hypothetical protein JSW34_02340 [candidate division Zixibacteria bacterium]